MNDADHISKQTNLPEATPSEVEQTREYKSTYLLPHPLSQLQSLRDYTELDQPVSGVYGLEDCVPGELCRQCVHVMTHKGWFESILLNTLTEPKPWLVIDEVELTMTWQLILAAQRANSVFVHQPAVDRDWIRPRGVH